MSASHTPGPFEYCGDRTIVAAGVPLARCYADRNAEGNGPLFAAAPDLLAALEGLERIVTAMSVSGIGKTQKDRLVAARAAIAKARAQ